LRWLTLDEGLQLTYASLEVGVRALEELYSAKEAGGRRVLPCSDRRNASGYKRGEKSGTEYRGHRGPPWAALSSRD
jgi:hypothetical protein